MKRGFTLIELLMVISIISLLSSIMYASLAQAREKARDSARIQQVNQIGNAVSLYKLDNDGRAPNLQGHCRAGAGAQASTCVAVSTSNPLHPEQQLAWTRFMDDIRPYMASAPVDPCASPCTNSVALKTGYTYVAPAAMEYICGVDCQISTPSLNESYQLYVILEAQPAPTGETTFGNYFIPSSISMPAPANLTLTYVDTLVDSDITLHWTNASQIQSAAGGNPVTILVEELNGIIHHGLWNDVTAQADCSAGNQCTIHVPNLNTYYFRVRAMAGGLVSPYSNEVHVDAR